ncbi:18S rRNA (guanine1575-N7)-methyltransferase [Nematocida sp. AWRm80]|nr:18S rRNA (guanine1575-N7)-methyltransferase [Nematocida sp. AWRm80]
MGRPEENGVKVYYTGEIAEKYSTSTSLNNIQSKITEKCLDIMNNPTDSLILDIGCGSGISTERILDDNNYVIGIDISIEMLRLAQNKIDNLFYGEIPANNHVDFGKVDIGQGLPFKTASFDYAVSVSVLQWLTVQPNSTKLLNAFFYTLYDVLKSDSTAVLQYYPETDKHMDQIMKIASKHGFYGGTLIENQDSKKKKKTYLILEMSHSKGQTKHVKAAPKQTNKTKWTPNRELDIKDWIQKKKQKRQARGYQVPEASKYTGRKRSGRLF